MKIFVTRYTTKGARLEISAETEAEVQQLHELTRRLNQTNANYHFGIDYGKTILTLVVQNKEESATIGLCAPEVISTTIPEPPTGGNLCPPSQSTLVYQPSVKLIHFRNLKDIKTACETFLYPGEKSSFILSEVTCSICLGKMEAFKNLLYVDNFKQIQPVKKEMVNHPDHYQTNEGIECIDAVEAALGPEGFQAFCRGTVMKYAWRSGKKHDAIEDMKKAKWYSDRAVESAKKVTDKKEEKFFKDGISNFGNKFTS